MSSDDANAREILDRLLSEIDVQRSTSLYLRGTMTVEAWGARTAADRALLATLDAKARGDKVRWLRRVLGTRLDAASVALALGVDVETAADLLERVPVEPRFPAYTLADLQRALDHFDTSRYHQVNVFADDLSPEERSVLRENPCCSVHAEHGAVAFHRFPSGMLSSEDAWRRAETVAMRERGHGAYMCPALALLIGNEIVPGVRHVFPLEMHANRTWAAYGGGLIQWMEQQLCW